MVRNRRSDNEIENLKNNTLKKVRYLNNNIASLPPFLKSPQNLYKKKKSKIEDRKKEI